MAMKSLIGQTIEIMAFPQASISEVKAFPSKTYSNRIFIMHGLGYPIEIDDLELSLIPPYTLHTRSNNVCNFTKGVVFRLKLTKNLLRDYLKQITIDHPSLNRREDDFQDSVRGVLLRGLITRDFHKTVYLCLVACNISSPSCFPLGMLRFFFCGAETVGDHFQINSSRSPDWKKNLSFSTIDDLQFFNFAQKHCADIFTKPTTQFARVFSLVTYSFSGNRFRPMESMIWSIAAVEAALGDGRSARGMIEARLRALLPSLIASGDIAKFKRLYDMRSNIVHGSSIVPAVFSEASVVSDARPFGYAAFAEQLAIKIIHEYFLRDTVQLKFKTVPDE